MLDKKIAGGHVVDGTGAPRRQAEVGVVDGRIVAIGHDIGQARELVDATDRIVAPGFVDVHSHFDAQVFWDPSLSPSSHYGITTTVSGNCGFTLAPLPDRPDDYLLRMLSVVEGMPLEALRASVEARWSTTGEFLDAIDGTLSINVGFMVGHSAIRRLVMGGEATTRSATQDERSAMKTLLRDGLEAGGLGFSSSWSPSHFDGDSRPVPSTFADARELIELAQQCRETQGTSLEFIPKRVDHFDSEQLDLLTSMSAQAQRAINWNVMRIASDNRSEVDRLLAAGTHASEHDARIIALAMPIPSRAHYSFRTGFVLNMLPDWHAVLSLPIPERRLALLDSRVRRQLSDGAAKAAGSLREIADWENRIIAQTFDPALRHHVGRRVGDIATENAQSPLDALLDIACADELRTTFMRRPTEPTREDWECFVAGVRDGRALIGASDAGAHLDFIAYYDYPAYVLAKAVRTHGVLPLEEAVHLMSDVPAQLYGLHDRGRLEVGSHADLVVFDEKTIAPGALEMRFDLPTGAGRLYSEPIGVDLVVVAGQTIVAAGKPTHARPGVVLRSGRDTRTSGLNA